MQATKSFRIQYYFDLDTAKAQQAYLASEGVETTLLAASQVYPYVTALVLSHATRLAMRRSHALLRKFYLQYEPIIPKRYSLTNHRMIWTLLGDHCCSNVAEFIHEHFPAEYVHYFQRQVAQSTASMRYLIEKSLLAKTKGA
jgi:hypothetical protein